MSSAAICLRMKCLWLALICFLALQVEQGRSQSSTQVRMGDPDGVGGIPYTSGPHLKSNLNVPYYLTLGLVVDSQQVAIPNVPLVVIANDGAIVANGVTDEYGLFAVDLPATVWLTVSLPLNGVTELPIEAGVPIVIVVP